MLDLAVVGAGPCGLAVGVAAKRAHLGCSLFDRGPVVASLMRYPLYMTFFSSPEKLEIGVPFVTAGDKPTRREALAYYRRVAEHFELDVRQYHEVIRVQRAATGAAGAGFELVARHPGMPEPETVRCGHVVYATGYFESANLLGVPGEGLPHVSHSFVEPHPFWQQRVVVVGGGNSAVEAALELTRVGAQVTIVHFLGEFDRGVQPCGGDHALARGRAPRAGRGYRAHPGGFRASADRLPCGPNPVALDWRRGRRDERHSPPRSRDDGDQCAGRLHRWCPGLGVRRQQDLHRERARARRSDLRPHQKQTPQSCPWGVIACSTSCALEPDASETKHSSFVALLPRRR